MAVRSKHRFEIFIGIDWSGARRSRNNKIRVAVCEPGESTPVLVMPSDGMNWSRDATVRWLIHEVKQKRVLAGIDFAFAYPYCDRNSYFPLHRSVPKSASILWRTVETICEAEPDFYGGSFYRNRTTKFSEYFCVPPHKGRYFDSRRLRKTEQVCANKGVRPASPFKCIGPDQVGPGSVAGMRVLHLLHTSHGKTLSIWPFDNLVADKSTLVEIFPRLFFAIAGQSPQGWKDEQVINAVLQYYLSKPLPYQKSTTYSEDDIDAIISAAALRYLSRYGDVWFSQDMDDETRTHEGWIFGCR